MPAMEHAYRFSVRVEKGRLSWHLSLWPNGPTPIVLIGQGETIDWVFTFIADRAGEELVREYE